MWRNSDTSIVDTALTKGYFKAPTVHSEMLKAQDSLSEENITYKIGKKTICC